jgi:anti-anti-sigma regulatory factor
MLAPQLSPAENPALPKLQVQKVQTSENGEVLCLRFAGVVDEDFNGAKLASTLSAKMLVIDLADVRRISSYGIAEWSDFIRAAGKRVEKIFLVACSPKVMDQLNLVSDFAGPARLHSFLAPYRCDYCDTESIRLFQLDQDWEVIRSRNPPEYPCQSCGHSLAFDDDPGVYLNFAASQGPVQMPPEVQTYITAELSTRLDDHGRPLGPTFWAEKFVKGGCSYLRLTGSLDGTFPAEKLGDGLEGVIVLDLAGIWRVFPAGGALWRDFMALITPHATAIYFVGVTPAFDRLTNAEDLGPRGQVVSLSFGFSCTDCRTSSQAVVDIAQHYDLIKMATPPERSCPDCKGTTVCTAPESVLARLPTLKKPDIDGSTRKFIEEAQKKLSQEKKPSSPQTDRPHGRGVTGVMMAASVLAVAAAAGVVAFMVVRAEAASPPVEAEASARLVRTASKARPAWLTSDMPLHADCQPAGETLRCTGVSSYAMTLEEARSQAEASALDAFVQYTGLQVTDAGWHRKVSGLYGAVRTAKLEGVEKARQQSDRSRYEASLRDVTDARAAVVKALRKTAGSLAPSQVSDEYWEEYELDRPGRRGFLAFAKVDLTVAQSKRLAQLYSTPVEVRGAKVVTVFPGVAWRFPDTLAGAMLLELDSGGLRSIGLTDRYIVTAVQDRVIDTADAFSTTLDQELDKLKSGGSIKLAVKTGDTMPVEFSHPVQAIVRPSSGESRGGRSRGGSNERDVLLNTWDRVGGSRDYRDDPRQ